jgi:TP901 family phage tail tape measure protein
MAERFNLTAQINLQAPNTKDVANKIRNDLNGIKASVDIKADPKALAAVTGQVQQIDKGAKTASRSVGLLNRNLTEAARRFSVITVATGTFISLARAIKTSVKDAIEFERELVRISQVTGKSVSQLTGLSQEVTRLATTLGVANASLLQTSRILAQAGLSAQKTQQALQVLANTTLAPSFDNIIDTTEGAIAILNQFGRAAAKTGNDIQFLEQSLDAINQVSKNFAVESADLISAVRRTGGVFQAAGGNINELIALFTSVRQTTRESAETIATGFRTIFTRLQRKDTLDALKELGIVLQDVEGNFVGPLKAIEALSVGLAVLDPKDVRFNEIVEQLGGFRQIGKVIPLLKQYAVTQQALAVANNASGSTAKDAQTAQQSLAVQFQKTREQFDALIRKFSQSDTFQDLAKTILRLAGAFLKVVESLETVLPLLASVAAIKIGKGLAPGVAGLVGGAQRRNSGGKILGFNRGGSVPGTGNRDTVPAMLTPGEFVIRKSSVQSIGAENLARMNNNKFNRGTTGRGVEEGRKIKDNRSPLRYGINTVVGQITPSGQQVTAKDTTLDTTLGRLRKSSGKNLQPNYDDQQKVVLAGKVSSLSLNKEDGESVFSEKAIVDPILNSGQRRIQKQINAIDGRLKVKNSLANDRNARNTIAGFAFESFVSGLSSVAAGGDQAPFDFVGAQTGRLSRFAEKEPIPAYLDAKRSKKDESVILRKALNEKTLAASARPFFRGGAVQKFATGGIVSQKAAGAAILDNIGPSKTAQVPISTQEVKNKFPEFRGLAKGKDPVSQFYKKTNFKVTKSGLDQSTSDKFKIALEDGLVAGVNFATDRLSADLGTPNAKIDPGQTSNFVKSINTSIFGRLFESSVDAIARQGDFSKPDTDTSRPFDAEGGLPGSLRDNFEGLPPRYIDLKSSLAAASDANLKGKVLDQVKRELTAQGILNVDYPGKEGRDKERQRRTGLTGEQTANKAISGAGFPVKRATGGGISGQDTVPALLTPGEFVFSKSAAQSIGYGTLNRMNVKGYNKGGVVQRFANGGGVSGAGDTGSGGNDPLTQIFGQIQSLVPSLIKSLKNFIASTDRFAGSVSILANVVKGSIGSINALKAETEQSTKQSDQTEKSDKDLEK